MSRTPIIFWGATGQAIVLHEFLDHAGCELRGVYDRNPNVKNPFEKVPIWNDESEFIHFLKDKEGWCFAVAIGGDGGRDRIEIAEKLRRVGLKPKTLIHPRSHLASDAVVGEGSQILINATLASRAEIGKQVILNSSSSVDHECKISDGCHIGPGAVLAGCIEVGECTFIGSGAVLLPGIKIGSHSIIGAGSVVTKNIPDGVIATGAPCRVVKKQNS